MMHHDFLCFAHRGMFPLGVTHVSLDLRESPRVIIKPMCHPLLSAEKAHEGHPEEIIPHKIPLTLDSLEDSLTAPYFE